MTDSMCVCGHAKKDHKKIFDNSTTDLNMCNSCHSANINIDMPYLKKLNIIMHSFQEDPTKSITSIAGYAKNKDININIKIKKLTKKQQKYFRAYTDAAEYNAKDIKIVIDKKYNRGYEFIETLFHEFTHACLRMNLKKIKTDDEEEKLAQIVGTAVKGIFEGFDNGPDGAKANKELAKKILGK